MLTLYIACLVFGGVLLVISLFSGGDADVDAGHDLGGGGDFDHSLDAGTAGDFDHSLDAGGHDFQIDAGQDVDLTDAAPGSDLPAEVHAELQHDGAALHDGPHHGSALSGAMQFFSFRNMVYLTTFFGLTGTVLTLGGSGFGLTLGASAGLGLFSAAVGHRFMRYLRKSESGTPTDLGTLAGRAARVTLPVGKSHKGKILLHIGDSQLHLLASIDESSEYEELPGGAAVVILRVESGIAQVDAADYIDT